MTRFEQRAITNELIRIWGVIQPTTLRDVQRTHYSRHAVQQAVADNLDSLGKWVIQRKYHRLTFTEKQRMLDAAFTAELY